jgi:Right handed beta helix region
MLPGKSQRLAQLRHFAPEKTCLNSRPAEAFMRFKTFFIIFLLTVLAMTGTGARAQANVVENQINFLYVDAQQGLDSNPGTIAQPVKTIQAAITLANANNQKGIGTKVIVNPGIYREFVSISPVSNQTGAVLTVEAATAGTAIIAGSDVLDNWSPESGNASIYSHPWTSNLTGCALPSGWPNNFAPIALQTEMVFVNDMPITQVMSYSQLQPGTFFVSAASDSIQIWPPPSTNMATAVVEVANRSETLSVSGRSNVVLRGLVFRHAATCVNQSGVDINSSSNVLVDQVQALWNNWGGLSVSYSTDVTVQKSVGSHNGGVGFQGAYDISTLYTFNESDYNNWRGAQAAFYDWAMGGTKLWSMRNATVQDHFSYNNQAQGLWFDTDNENMTINNATLAGNVQTALQIERNEGPITIENSHLCLSGGGLTLLTSEAVTVQNNTFYNNGGTNKYQGEIYLAGTAGGQVITNWQTGASVRLFTTGTVITGNTIEDAGPGQNVFGTYLSGTDWSDFANTLNAGNNKWYDPYVSNSFKIEDDKLLNLPGWQNALGTDYSSTWALPSSSPEAACTIPAPSFSDFNINLDNDSYVMTAGKAVATVRVNSFAFGPVTFNVTGLPKGVRAALSQSSLVSGVATLTLTASSKAVAQTVPITLFASGNNVVHSATFYVTVDPATLTILHRLSSLSTPIRR